jgi:hypothetical protein
MACLVNTPVRNFRKTAQPGYYNLRFRPSQGLDNVYVQYTANIHGAGWSEQVTYSNTYNFNSTKLKETQASSLIATSFSRTISKNGDLELLITCIRSTREFTDQMMDGPDACSATPLSVS